MFTGEVCNREVIVVARNTSIVDAARLMRVHHVGDLVVVEDRAGERTPVGIVTDRDIVVEVIAQSVPLDALVAGDIMSPELLTAQEGDMIWDTLERMRAKGVRRVPVVDARGALVGIVSVDDLLGILSEELTALARLVKNEQLRERMARR
jgi:CBS-domain-containing membrane protein